MSPKEIGSSLRRRSFTSSTRSGSSASSQGGKKPKNPEGRRAAYKARMAVADSLTGIFRFFKVLQPVTK